VSEAQGHIRAGHEWVVDMDLEKFFDRVNHDALMGRVAKRVADKRLLRVIRGYLTAGVLDGGLVSRTEEGTPQGGPLSPLLSNLMLDDLDRELEQRGHRFVRYADDCNIYVRSERAGERVLAGVTKFVERKLKLRVNAAKSAVGRPWERKFLGFNFTQIGALRAISAKALERCKRQVRDKTRRTKGQSIEKMTQDVGRWLKSWLGYFGFCQTPDVFKRLGVYVRHRLRAAIWKQLKTGRRRYADLRRRGILPNVARGAAASPHGPYRMAASRAMRIAYPNEYFVSHGLPTLLCP
jgi:RNA-directed DNA polymerase